MAMNDRDERLAAYGMAASGYRACLIKARNVRERMDARVADLRSNREYAAADMLRAFANELDQAIGYYPDFARKAK